MFHRHIEYFTDTFKTSGNIQYLTRQVQQFKFGVI